MELYSVSSVMKQVEYKERIFEYADINFAVTERQQTLDVDYSAVIKDYDEQNKGHIYQKEAINELFTLGESQQFAEWLKQSKNMDCRITLASLPFDFNTIGYSAIDRSDGTYCYEMNHHPKYNLDFNVYGYANYKHYPSWAKDTWLVKQWIQGKTEAIGFAEQALSRNRKNVKKAIADYIHESLIKDSTLQEDKDIYLCLLEHGFEGIGYYQIALEYMQSMGIANLDATYPIYLQRQFFQGDMYKE